METSRHEIRPRNPGLTFASIPRHWFAGSPLFTHMANGVNLVFPDGERFFVRSVRYYLDRIQDDPELLAQVKGFAGQEGRHAKAHEDFFDALRAQGYDLDKFMKWYRKISYEWLEKAAPPALRLSATAALEHFTATMAENVFTERYLDEADPTMARLMYWHAAEEIEHKAVAFDVLKRVHPSYALRVGGMVIAAALLAGFWVAGTSMLLAQDRAAGIDTRPGAQERERGQEGRIARTVFLRGIREYLRPDFHPLQNDNLHVAREYLASAGMA
jgi:predicted metal-dependent hydrolase